MRKTVIVIITILVICVLALLLLKYVGASVISKHISCSISEIDINNITVDKNKGNSSYLDGYGLTADEYDDIANNPQQYRQVYVIASPSLDLPVRVYNFNVNGIFDTNLSAMIVGEKIFVNNLTGDDSNKYVEVHNGDLEFNFLVRVDDKTYEQIIQYVKNSQFKIEAHTIIPFVNVSFYAKESQ